MASVVWIAVFFLLMAEIVVTAILVLPLPRALRRFIAKKILTYDLGRRVRFFSNFIILGLMLAVYDAISTLRHLENKESGENTNVTVGDPRGSYISTSFDKQRKFRAERNMYLSGFALTLMFVIARIVELMQQIVNAEEETDALKQRLDDIGTSKTTVLPNGENKSEDSAPSTLRKRSTAASDPKND